MKKEISLHEARFYKALLHNGESWHTGEELAEQSAVAVRTARMFAKQLSDCGVVECAKVFPAHRYRISTGAASNNPSYLTRMKAALEVFNLI